MNSEYLSLLLSAMCLMLVAGFAIGLMLNVFRQDERDGTGRTPNLIANEKKERFKPKSQPFRNSPDMLRNGDEDK